MHSLVQLYLIPHVILNMEHTAASFSGVAMYVINLVRLFNYGVWFTADTLGSCHILGNLGS
jgi:hypothetical protein